jgi:hypothetical protein
MLVLIIRWLFYPWLEFEESLTATRYYMGSVPYIFLSFEPHFRQFFDEVTSSV